MNNDIKAPMGSINELVEALVKKYGGPRAAGRELEVEYQYLQYWSKNGRRLQDFLEFLERVRKKEKLSKSAMWDKIMTAKK